MTKSKADKERKREKRKKEERARDQQRRQENARTARLIKEGLDECTARGLAAIYSVPARVLSGEDRPKAPRPLVSTPEHYASIKAQIDRSGATRYIEQFSDAMSEIHAFSPHDELQAVAFICHDVNGGCRAEPTAMPGDLLFMSPAAEKWLERELVCPTATAVAWLVWRSTVPVVFAMDRGRNLALWFLDEDYKWHPASQAQMFLTATAKVGRRSEYRTVLRALLDVYGAGRGCQDAPASADDPRAVSAVEAYCHGQEESLRAFFHMADRHDESNETLDYVAAENERIGRLERELAKAERRLAQTEQERDMARSALSRERPAANRKKDAPLREEVCLVDRLATVFA